MNRGQISTWTCHSLCNKQFDHTMTVEAHFLVQIPSDEVKHFCLGVVDYWSKRVKTNDLSLLPAMTARAREQSTARENNVQMTLWYELWKAFVFRLCQRMDLWYKQSTVSGSTVKMSNLHCIVSVGLCTLKYAEICYVRPFSPSSYYQCVKVFLSNAVKKMHFSASKHNFTFPAHLVVTVASGNNTAKFFRTLFLFTWCKTIRSRFTSNWRKAYFCVLTTFGNVHIE